MDVGATGGRAYVEVRDDGVGFRAACEEGLGLIAVRERARDLGAELSAESDPGRGTRVRVERPCDGAGEPG